MFIGTYGYSQCACVYMDCDGDIICDFYTNCGGNINSCNQSFGQCGNETCNPTCGNSLQPCQIYPGQGTCNINSMPNGACWYYGGQCNPAVICNIITLPVTLIKFNVVYNNDHNYITFTTSSEINNSHFIIQYSDNGVTFENMVYLPGNGNTNHEISYFTRHYGMDYSINYYKLLQVDFDGKTSGYGPLSVDNRNNKYLVKTINTMGQEVDEKYIGVVIKLYNDGSSEKINQINIK
jgi:hypothetical protein